MKLFIIVLLTAVSCEELPTPSSELKPRDFNPHGYLDELDSAEPTKQGPVLFPNDAPPPPRPPLIVTSRPLIEAIARSELADNTTVTSQSQNIVASLQNRVASQSQDRVSFVPFLATVKDYRPYIPSPTFDYHISPTRVPYADLLKKTRVTSLQRDNRYYDDYEEQTVLPPIYKALSDHAAQKVLKTQQQKQNHYQVEPVPYTRQYLGNNIDQENNSEYDDQNQNYAFSYTVKDQKTGDDFSHSQQSSGSATNGEYRVRLPDGRMQIVSYTADENGYKADVRYDDDDKAVGNTVDDDHQQSNYANQQNNYGNQHNSYINQINDKENQQLIYQTPKYKYVTIKPQNYVIPSYITPQYHNFVGNQQTDYSRHVDYTDRSNKQDYDATDKKEFKSVDKGEKDYYQYPDVSKEYYTDYSSEYNSNLEPHRSKFNFVDNRNVEITNKATASTVKPSYEELKDLFVTKSLYNTKQNYNVEFNVPSTTPFTLDATTERVVNIGGKTPNLYTNIKHSLPLYNVTPVPVYASPKVVVATTPKSYLVSTIASLKNKVSLATKPVLSDDFISRINKYIGVN